MTITLLLDPEVEHTVETAAMRAGLTVEQYALAAVRSAAEAANKGKRQRSLLELRGLGAELWQDPLTGKTSQDYVNDLRDEWDERA